MAEDYSIYAKITGDSKGFESAVNSAKGSVNSFEQSFTKLQKLVGVGFAVAGIKKFASEMNKMANLYVIQEKAEKSLQVAAKNNPYIKDENVKELKNYASQLQSISEVGDEKLLPMMSKLIAAGRTQAEIQAIMSAAVDASATGAISLESAVNGLNQSYEGNVGQLRRLIPSLANLSAEELKSGKAVDEVARAYKGMAESTASSAVQLQNSIGDLKEQLGYGWENALSPMRKGLQSIIDKWTEALKKANDAKEAMNNLSSVIESGGNAGNVTDAKTLQAGRNAQLQNEYRELARFAEIAGKELKKLSKEEKEIYKDMMTTYGLYVQKYQDEGLELVDAIKKVQADKLAEWKKGLDDFQMIVQKEKELEEEQARIDAENASQEAINRRKALTDAYDETIAKAREEIEIHRQMGEEITKEEESAKMLEVMKQAYVKMIQESNGELKIEKTRLAEIIKLEEELKKAIKEVTKAREEDADKQDKLTKTINELNVDVWRDFKKAVEETTLEIKAMAENWTPFFKDDFKQFGKIAQQTFEALGQSIAGNNDAWDNYGANVLNIMAEILQGLSAQLAALAVAKAMVFSYGEAVAAASASAIALVSAGVLKGVASNIKKVSNSAKEANGNLEKFKELLTNITTAGTSGGTSTLASQFTATQKAIEIATSNLSEYEDELNKAKYNYESYISYYEKNKYRYSWMERAELKEKVDKAFSSYKDALESYGKASDELTEAQNAWNEMLKETEENLKATNQELETEISVIKKLYKENTEIAGKEVYGNILTSIKKTYDSFVNMGSEIGDKIINGITNGITTSDFLSDLKEYIKSTMLKVAVFTEGYTKRLSDATTGLLKGLTTGDSGLVENSKTAIEALYNSALETSKVVESTIDKIFTSVKTKTTSAVQSVEEHINKLKETGYTDISQTIAENIISSGNVSKLKAQKNALENQIKGFYNVSYYSYYMDEWESQVEKYQQKIAMWDKYIEQEKQNPEHMWSFPDVKGILTGDAAIAQMKKEQEKFYALIDDRNAKINEGTKYLAEYKQVQDKLDKVTKEYTTERTNLNNSWKTLSETLKGNNTELQNLINGYKELFSGTGSYQKSAVLQTQLNALKQQFYSFFEELNNMAVNVGSNLVDSLVNGMSQADFLSSMKDYIRKAIIQTVVYTETLQHEIAQIGATISKGIAEGFTDTGLHEIKRDLSYIFYMAQNSISKIDSVLDNVFSGYATGTQNATRGLHLVGEAGPELVRFRGGEQVLNANNTQKALSGSGTTINQNVTFNNLNDTSAYAMMQQFKRYNREMAINGIF